MAERPGQQKRLKRAKPPKNAGVPAAEPSQDHAPGEASHKLPFLVVGMGASAGGLEAFEKFFSRMPADSGLAFVLVPHLDATHKSSMVELLRRYTSMRVMEIADDTKMAPDCIYIIPPNASLSVAGGRLRVATPRSEPGTVDPFFRSLAADQGDNAVGIVLSGSGSDGTAGIRAIKEHGGLTVAQAAESSRFGSMPHSAVATGLVDFVLPVEEMPERLMEYARHLAEHRTGGGNGFGNHERRHLVRIYTLLRRRTGHDFSRYKDSTFIRRVQRRMQVVQLASVEDYIGLLRKDPREIDLLFRDLLIGVTHFFRDRRAFTALATDVIPKLVEGKTAEDQLRVWVPGCATGEEAYSLAMLIREALAKRDVAPKVSIFATDIDDEALEVARAGLYPASIANDLTPERLERFFVRDGSSFRVIKDIREMCIFSLHNLIKNAPFSKLDLISCRNLLIYLDASLQNRIIPLFHFALRHGGYLFLGPSENVTQHAKLFTKVDGKYRIFKAHPVAAERPVLEFPLSAGTYRNHLMADKPAANSGLEETASRRAARVMEAYTPAYVVLDDHYDIVHFSGRTGKYLQPSPGAASLNLFNILETSLRPDVRTVLHRAATTGQRSVRENALLTVNGGTQAVNIIAEPLPSADGPRHLVLAFQEMGPVKPREHVDVAPGDDAHKDETIRHLEAELLATRERLQATIEELETSNEEMKASNEEFQSVNEELQSSNEELETSKEELQSVNEELETVNAELNSKLESLERATNDRKNLLESTQIATIFLDNALQVKSFTPAVTELFHLIDTDYGRPITHITSKLTYAHLERDVRKVTRTLERVEQEVAAADGSAIYMMRILPYRTVDNMIDGVVITFIDITERKHAEEGLARLAAIVESSLDAIIAMAPDGTITTWNAGAERMYGYTGEEAVGSSLSLILSPEKKGELRTVIERGRRPRVGEPIEMERVAKDGRRLIVASTVSPVRNAAGKVIALSAIERDVTERKHAEERQHMLVAELNHRVKNTLATVLSLLRQSLRHSSSIKEFSQAFEGRIRALAKSHDLLAASNWAGVDLEALVVTALAPYRERGDRVVVSGDAVTMNAAAALLFGMILHELATNAAKYGALSNERGQVEVAWMKNARTKQLNLTWGEKNGPRGAEPGRAKGFGMTLIERGLAHELKGDAKFDFRDGGLRCTLEVPLSEIEAEGGAVVRRKRP